VLDPEAETRAAPAEELPGSPRNVLRESVKAKLFAQSKAPTIGRYAVLQMLGEGGMGTVYAVYDDRLDRRVALKLVKGSQSDAARSRMLREAQAMAKLSHPNVVPVYEVGEERGQLFVAMEYVQGVTLRQWSDAQARDWADVLERYIQAGRGLAAAHAQGLVHRDFKPHNAMVGDDGRVRVLDFGLAARYGGSEDEVEMSGRTPRPREAALDTPITETGSVMGTPAYMAPEQFAAGVVDRRSDQFSYCVALWEALYGTRPFKGDDVAQSLERVKRGALEPTVRTDVPAGVREALERGLKLEPDERWPSMEQLLSKLESFTEVRLPSAPRDVRVVEAWTTLFAVGIWSAVLFVEVLLRWAIRERDGVPVGDRQLGRSSIAYPSYVDVFYDTIPIALQLIVASVVTTALVGLASRKRLVEFGTTVSWARLAGRSWPWTVVVFGLLLLSLERIEFVLYGSFHPDLYALIPWIVIPLFVSNAMPMTLWFLQRRGTDGTFRPWHIAWRVSAAVWPLHLLLLPLIDLDLQLAIVLVAFPTIVGAGVGASLAHGADASSAPP
jgi:predicted Ser/Thr protein kinase